MKRQVAVIGLEMHCELKSKSKVFSRAKNEYNEVPNSNVRPLDMGLPGILPVVNKKSVEEALMVSLSMNCEVPKFMYFDRKNYFYPDLPKGYQITQMAAPVGINGYVEIETKNGLKKVLIHDVHLEEDTASLDHYFDTTTIDYNRSGVPLLELVTNPCLSSAEEAVAFLEQVIRMYRYMGVSDADTKRGQVRCDVNVSIHDEDTEELGTRVEVKNVNSISGVSDAINYEIKRQTELKMAGKYNEVYQETRRWDEEALKTVRMRSKEDAIDYKYFVEPNIPKIKLSQEYLEMVKKNIPRLALERKQDYMQNYGLSDYDAGVLVKSREVADYFEEVLSLGVEAKAAANWITTQILGYLNKVEENIRDIYMTPKRLRDLIRVIEEGKISSKQAKEVFNKVLEEKKEVQDFISSDNVQMSDREELVKLISEIVEQNPSQVEAYYNGKTNLFDFFVGQVMKNTRGKANPVMTKEILSEILNR